MNLRALPELRGFERGQAIEPQRHGGTEMRESFKREDAKSTQEPFDSSRASRSPRFN